MPPESVAIREQFPALAGETVFLENAGGSQVPAVVADAVRDYMLRSYVQLGAGYELSRQSTETVERAHAFAKLLMNATGGEVALGPSTSALLQMLAGCYGRLLGRGDEVVVAECGHEANVGPWVRLGERGVRVRWWRVDPVSGDASLEALEALLSPRTAIVALPHVSNLLGEIVDVRQAADLAHGRGARLVVDGVAYAPHRAMDVAAWDVDWYAFSAYKVYGPHLAALYGKTEAFEELRGPNHFFIPASEVPYKFELGGVCHEGCAGLVALGDYLRFLAGEGDGRAGGGTPVARATVEVAYAVMEACERPLQERLVGYLESRPELRLLGPRHAGPGRVGTVSFVHPAIPSREITAETDRRGIGIRHGHMYAYRLVQALGLDPADGVVRVSLVHYNTPAEIERLIAVLDRMR